MTGILVLAGWIVGTIALLLGGEYALRRLEARKLARRCDDVFATVAEQHRDESTPIHDRMICESYEREFRS